MVSHCSSLLPTQTGLNNIQALSPAWHISHPWEMLMHVLCQQLWEFRLNPLIHHSFDMSLVASHPASGPLSLQESLTQGPKALNCGE